MEIERLDKRFVKTSLGLLYFREVCFGTVFLAWFCSDSINYAEQEAYLFLRKCRLKAKKARAKVTPTLAMQVTVRKAAGAIVTIRNLRVNQQNSITHSYNRVQPPRYVRSL